MSGDSHFQTDESISREEIFFVRATHMEAGDGREIV